MRPDSVCSKASADVGSEFTRRITSGMVSRADSGRSAGRGFVGEERCARSEVRCVGERVAANGVQVVPWHGKWAAVERPARKEAWERERRERKRGRMRMRMGRSIFEGRDVKGRMDGVDRLGRIDWRLDRRRCIQNTVLL